MVTREPNRYRVLKGLPDEPGEVNDQEPAPVEAEATPATSPVNEPLTLEEKMAAEYEAKHDELQQLVKDGKIPLYEMKRRLAQYDQDLIRELEQEHEQRAGRTSASAQPEQQQTQGTPTQAASESTAATDAAADEHELTNGIEMTDAAYERINRGTPREMFRPAARAVTRRHGGGDGGE